jgi:hypothetical protein
MGPLLLHHPLIQFYVVLVTVLFIAFFWDYYLRSQAAETRRPRQEVAQRGTGVIRAVARPTMALRNRPRVRRTVTGARLMRGEGRLQGTHTSNF